MNDDIKGLRDDIAFMRALAEEGRAPPLLGGVTLVAAGVTFGLASLGQWTIVTGLVRATPLAYSVVWLAATIIFVSILTVLRTRSTSMPGAHSPNNRAAGTAWAGVGWGIFTLAASVAVVGWRAHSPVPLMLLPSIVLALYGLGWSVAAAVSRQRWIWMTAIGSYLSALVMALLSDQPVVYLVYAAALILLAALPGLILMRQEPSLTV